MSELHTVVARFLDGRVVNGTTDDFSPDKSSFHVYPMDSSAAVTVQTRELKALFFVKSLMGNSDRHDVRSFLQQSHESTGEKIAVRFKDGEITCGYTDNYVAKAPGFFLLPASESSNNKRAYILVHATEEVKTGAQAEALLRGLLRSEAA